MRVVYDYEKEYRVLVAARPDEEQLTIWRRGVVFEDGTRTLPAEVRFESTQGKGARLRVIMREGKKRQIREVGKTIGLSVVKIIRVRIGSLLLESLKPREWRHLTTQELAALKGQEKQAGPKSKTPRLKPKPARPKTSKQRHPAAGSKPAAVRSKPTGGKSRPGKSGESGRSRRPPGRGERR